MYYVRIMILRIKNTALIVFATIVVGFFAASPALTATASSDTPYSPTQTFAAQYDADCEVPPGVDLDTENCGIVAYLVLTINMLSALAGMAIVASIMIAGFQYMTARDNSGQIEAARKRIVWALIALLLFVFMYAFLNFIVPGGVL
jgi:hypothetical protein